MITQFVPEFMARGRPGIGGFRCQSDSLPSSGGCQRVQSRELNF